MIGLPGGVRSPFMRVLEEENIHGMRLVEGRGNAYRAGGRASEGDDFNTVWIVDSATLPFYQAEVYHQFHNGIGEAGRPAGWLLGGGGSSCRWWDLLCRCPLLPLAQLPSRAERVLPARLVAAGERFPAEYTQGLKETALRAGRINPTGCPEYSFGSSSQ